MTWLSGELVSLLTFLLPGFVAAGIFYSLTSHPKPNAFDRLVQALIFTVLGQAITSVTVLLLNHRATKTYNTLGDDLQLAVLVLVAILLGLIAAFVSNKDLLHTLLRSLRITNETSYPSEWYSAFSRNSGSYVVLHLAGQRRLYGWPLEWPSSPDNGHFRIAEAEWLVDTKDTPAEHSQSKDVQQRIPVKGVSAILIPAAAVEMIEFMEMHTSELDPE